VDPDPASPPPVAPEPRQRWRLVVGRGPEAPPLAQRDLADAWSVAVEASGLPAIPGSGDPPKPRLAFGAPLPIGMTAEAELIDLLLAERWPRWRVREALEPRIPAGWRLIDLADVWLGGPALAGAVAAADYRITLEVGDGVTRAGVATAAKAVIGATSLPRSREKGGGSVEYDLRPLLIALAVDGERDGPPPLVVRARTRFHPSLGTGRPEEVVAALTDALGHPLTASTIVRERLLLADELE
jgi:radical SAM-linked protein